MKVAAKEADEVIYFLMLCEKSDFYPNPDTLVLEANEISLILSKIISTAKKSQ